MKDQISMWENEGGKPIKENGTTYADEITHKESKTLDTKKGKDPNRANQVRGIQL